MTLMQRIGARYLKWLAGALIRHHKRQAYKARLTYRRVENHFLDSHIDIRMESPAMKRETARYQHHMRWLKQHDPHFPKQMTGDEPPGQIILPIQPPAGDNTHAP
jgi:hypothetical protein